MKQLLFTLLLVFTLGSIRAQRMENVIEIRSYNLKPNARKEFNRLFIEQALPMLQRWQIQVVAYGPSLHDENSYFLARAFTDLKDRERREDAFYGSDEWKKGPRDAVLALIDSYVTVVVPASTFSAQTLTTDQVDDLAELSKLNKQFIKNFINQDTVAHNEIIHKDFVCIQNNGTLMERKEYMKSWASDYSSANFIKFGQTDEVIRLFGKTALVRSMTPYTKMSNGKEISGRSVYTDTYIKENGRWWCVQAQITPQTK